MSNTRHITYSLTFISALILLISCGGGGSNSGGGTVAGGGAAGEEGGGGGTGGGDQGGEGAGNCKSLNLQKFRFDLVRVIPPISQSPEKKKLEIRGYSGSLNNRDLDLTFITNHGGDTGGFCDIECGNPEFVKEYEQAFGVINTDCNA